MKLHYWIGRQVQAQFSNASFRLAASYKAPQEKSNDPIPHSRVIPSMDFKHGVLVSSEFNGGISLMSLGSYPVQVSRMSTVAKKISSVKLDLEKELLYNCTFTSTIEIWHVHTDTLLQTIPNVHDYRHSRTINYVKDAIYCGGENNRVVKFDFTPEWKSYSSPNYPNFTTKSYNYPSSVPPIDESSKKTVVTHSDVSTYIFARERYLYCGSRDSKSMFLCAFIFNSIYIYIYEITTLYSCGL